MTFLHGWIQTKGAYCRAHKVHSYGAEMRTTCLMQLNFLFLPLSLLQLKNKFMKKLPRDAEASNVLVGEVDFLESPFIAFVRLQQAVMLGALTEVPVPTR